LQQGNAVELVLQACRQLAKKARAKSQRTFRKIGELARPWLRPLRTALRRRIPTAFITGTKGKTTTTRMLARILSEAGHAVGFASTDGITITGKLVYEGDSASYAGARRVLNEPTISTAVLETARGVLLHHGLYVGRCDVAALLNIGREQIGIDGIDTLEQMAKLKRKILDAASGTVVLNADDRFCRELMAEFSAARTSVFSFDPESGTVSQHLKKGGAAFCLDESERPQIVRLQGDEAQSIAFVSDMPATWGGVVRHNIANALAAAALADGLGIDLGTIRAGLHSFDLSLEQSPGRFNIIRESPTLVILDNAMSPPAAEALAGCLAAVKVKGRKRCMMTSAGNRPDWHYAEVVAALVKGFDHFVCYEWKVYRRGRAPGEITLLLKNELLRQGVEPGAIDAAQDYETGLQMLSAKSRPGDLVVVLGVPKRKDMAMLRAMFSPPPDRG
jgi:cyanophycin synthetase